jgi:hypothetical protein
MNNDTFKPRNTQKRQSNSIGDVILPRVGYSRIGYGRLEVEKNWAVRLRINNDLINFYLWLIKRRFYGDTGATLVNNDRYFTPRHGAHISCVINTIHGWKPEYNLIKYNAPVAFYYNPENIIFGGSQRKGFSNFWCPVDCPFLDGLKKNLGINDDKNFLGLHFTIASNKVDRIKK